MATWTAFTLGLLGSLHCAGMCGPIMLAVPWGRSGRPGNILTGLLYHLGRIATYSALGAVTGYIGGNIAISGYQNVLSITMGVLIVIAIVVPGGWRMRLFEITGIDFLLNRFRNLWGRFIKIESPFAVLVMGIFNGLLPCGLVYVALAGAVSTESPYAGAAYMAAFGLGTTPMMIAVSFLGIMAGRKARGFTRRLIPAAALVLATLFILRGLSLGIPYVSPRVVAESDGRAVMECCRPAHSSGAENAR